MAKVSKEQIAGCLDPRVFELILLPTEQCNFRCTYCYEDFLIGKMPRAVINGVKNLISNRAESMELLALSWFGGESLVAMDVITEIGTFAKELSERRGFYLSGGLTTNGSLITPKVLETLAQLNQRKLQITLDGDRDQHNQTRIRANGSGTFDAIWKNLLLIRDLDEHFDVTLRLHVSRGSVEGVRRLLPMLQAEFGASNRFSIHFHRISDLGGPGGGSVEPLGWSEYKSILEDLTGRTSVPASSEVQLAEQGEICYAAKPNSLLIRADGRVGKCTVALNDPRNDVGVLNEEGAVEFNDPRLQLWFEGFRNFDADTLGCPLGTLGKDPVPHRSKKPIELALM